MDLFKSDEKDKHKQSKICIILNKKYTFLGALLSVVLEKLGLRDSPDVKKLSPFALRSISKVTRVFTIEGPDNELKIRFNTKRRENLDDTIVYVVSK